MLMAKRFPTLHQEAIGWISVASPGRIYGEIGCFSSLVNMEPTAWWRPNCPSTTHSYHKHLANIQILPPEPKPPSVGFGQLAPKGGSLWCRRPLDSIGLPATPLFRPLSKPTHLPLKIASGTTTFPT